MKNRPQTKVLLVDDEPNILVAIEFLLEQQGYKVFKSHNGLEGLQKADEIIPDVILLDVMMPGMDGFEVAQKIRENSKLDFCRIIFLTARGTQEDKIEGYAKGGEIYITKPFDNDALINTVNEVIEFG